MPIGRTAATWNVWSPGVRPVYVTGEEHGVAGARSSEHWNVAVPCVEKNVNVTVVGEVHGARSAPSNEHMYETPVWSDVQLNVALVLVVVVPFVFAGTLAVIVVSAGPSTSHSKVTGVRSKLPAGSIARTSSLW